MSGGGTTLGLRITATGPAANANAHTNNNAHVYTIAHTRIEILELNFLDNAVNFGRFTPTGAPYQHASRYYALESAGVDLVPFTQRLNTSRNGAQLEVRISFRVTYYGFHHKVVEQMAYDVADGHNFADPVGGGANAILATTTRVQTQVNPSDTDWTVTFHGGNQTFNNVLLALTQFAAQDATTMLMTVNVDLPNSALAGAVQLGILQALIAADWSRWYDELGLAAMAQHVDAAWESNIRQYMRRYISLTRGAGLIDAARALAQAASGTAIADPLLDDTERQRAVVVAARNELDRFLITSNPWGQSTNVGNYPVRCHVILAALYSRFDATPVRLMRRLRTDGTITLAQKIDMVAQVGMGNCGEHAQVTYVCFENLMVGHGPSAGLMRLVVRSGYANIDHAFCVGGEAPVEIIQAVVRTDHHGAHEARNDTKTVWDAKAAVAAGPRGAGRVGWICDPYLALNEIAETLDELDPRVREWVNWDAAIHPAAVIATRVDAHASDATHIHVTGYCDQPATITSITPVGGPSAGNTAVTIDGTHFEPAIMAGIATLPLSAVVVVNSTRLTGQTPARVVGPAVAVKVKNPADPVVTRAGLFTYRDAPTVALNGAAPALGKTDGTTVVTVTGTGFVGPCKVFFDNVEATHVNVGGATTLTCRPAAHAASAAVAVKVENVDTQSGERAALYRFLAPPTVNVDGANPAHGTAAGHTRVTVTGTGLVAPCRVFFGDDEATNVDVAGSELSLACDTPPHAAGQVAVKVRIADGQEGQQAGCYTFDA